MTETYWVGDLCYVMHDCWAEVCAITFSGSDPQESGPMTLEDGREFVYFGTAHGDGVYGDQDGNTYPVDSGGIGAIRLSDIRDLEPWIDGGHLHEFPKGAVMSESFYSEGVIVIGGTVFIDTDPTFDEEDEGL